MTRAEIDAKFLQWANARDLRVDTIDQWDEKAHHALVVDNSGDIYVVFAGPDPKDPDYPNSKRALVGAALSKRGAKRYHAPRRERERFQFQQLVSFIDVEAALETSFMCVGLWISEAGHTFEPRLAKHDDA